MHSFPLCKSCQPRHNKQSIINNLLLRFKRFCSNDKMSLSDASKLFKYILTMQCLFSCIFHHFAYLEGLTDTHCFLTTQNCTTDMLEYSLYLVLGLTIVQQPVCTSKQPPNLHHLLVWNTITDYKPHGRNRVANINVKYANAPTLHLNIALINI